MNLLRAVATVSSFTFVSRILGFARDLVIARIFGASIATDAFFVAFRLPNLLRRLFAEGAFSQAFVPILSEYKNNQDEQTTRQLIDKVATALTFSVMIVSLIGILAAPLIVELTAPGFKADASKFALTVSLTRITFPYIFFMALVAMAAGILNTWNRFSVPAFTPVLLNLSFIVMALVAGPYFSQPVYALAWAVFIGGILQLALQIPALMKLKLLPRFNSDWRDPGVKRIMKLMVPAVFGVSVAQLSLVLNTIFASFLQTGSVTWLYYADRLMEFPSGMLGVALGTVILPSLSKHYADKDSNAYSALLDWGLRITVLLTLPSALALAMLATPLISALFFHGAFTVIDVAQTRSALMAYSIGLLGMIAIKILAPGFYARQNVGTPVRIAIFSLIATQAMNLLFIGTFKHAGLALSIGLAACLNAGLLLFFLLRHKIYHPQSGWLVFLVRIVFALLVLGLVMYIGVGKNEFWLTASALERSIHLSILVVVSVLSYFFALYISGMRVSHFKRTS